MSPVVQANVALPLDRIRSFCARWGVREVALFGSVLRNDFRDDSDVDVLLTFTTGNGITFENYPVMRDELSALFGGRRVDLVERRAVERSENYIRRRQILQSAKPVYVAG